MKNRDLDLGQIFNSKSQYFARKDFKCQTSYICRDNQMQVFQHNVVAFLIIWCFSGKHCHRIWGNLFYIYKIKAAVTTPSLNANKVCCFIPRQWLVISLSKHFKNNQSTVWNSGHFFFISKFKNDTPPPPQSALLHSFMCKYSWESYEYMPCPRYGLNSTCIWKIC